MTSESTEAPPAGGFLSAPPETGAVRRLYDDDVEEHGHVMNLTRVWAHVPELVEGLMDLAGTATRAAGLTVRDRGVLVAACASTLGDSYCSLAWGTRLAAEAGAEVAAGVLGGDDSGLSPAEAALARWARQVARDPNGATAADVQVLRDAGYDDARILAITAYVALRLAFSTVNDALGARPDREVAERAPGPVRDAVGYGRPVADGPG